MSLYCSLFLFTFVKLSTANNVVLITLTQLQQQTTWVVVNLLSYNHVFASGLVALASHSRNNCPMSHSVISHKYFCYFVQAAAGNNETNTSSWKFIAKPANHNFNQLANHTEDIHLHVHVILLPRVGNIKASSSSSDSSEPVEENIEN